MKMPGEPIQETLANCMDKLCTALGLFFTDAETQHLLLTFVDNMKSSSVVIRRTATECAISICEGSSSPYYYLTILVRNLFILVNDSKNPDTADTAVLLGGLLGFRKAMLSYQKVCKTVTPQKQLLDEDLTNKLFSVLVDMLEHEVHNVVTASLEALQQFLKILRRHLLTWFRTPEVYGRVVDKLGHILLSKGKVRVSIRALALSCLTNVILYEPAGLRHHIPDCDAKVFHIITRYLKHNDPMVRGNVYIMVGNTIKASLEQQEFVFDAVPPSLAASSEAGSVADADSITDEPPSMAAMCATLANSLLDATSTAARQACQAVRTCLHCLCLSSLPEYGLVLLEHLLARDSNNYWLVKVELLETFGELDFQLLAYIEETVSMERRNACLQQCPVTLPRHPFHRPEKIQTRILDSVLGMLSDNDGRVREAASNALLRFVSRLYYPQDWEVNDSVAAMVERHTDSLLNKGYNSEQQNGLPVNMSEHAFNAHASIPRANLSRIVARVVSVLHSSQSHELLIGCYHALSLLTTQSKLPAIIRVGDGRQPTASSRLPPVFVPDILPLVLDHLRVAWMSLELSTHVNILSLVSNLSKYAPAAHLRPYTNLLLTHILRVLNICVHITNGNEPPKAVPLSPRQKKQSPMRRSSVSSPASTPTKGDADTENEDTDDASAVPPGSPKGYFAHLSHYRKLYDTMKGSYNAEIVTLDTNKVSSKFGDMVRVSLEILAVVVEHQGIAFQSCAQEVLG